MKSILKAAALFVAVACAVWLAALWRWHAMRHDPDERDVVLYLGLLPVVVFALALAMRWAVRGALARQDAAAAAVAAAAGDPKAVDASATDADARRANPWHLLAAWINAPGGDSADALLAAIDANEPRPKPDAELRDDDGLPIMSARIAGLDTDSVDAALARAAEAAALAAKTGQEAPPRRAVRALACLLPLLDELSRALPDWLAGLDAAAHAPGRDAVAQGTQAVSPSATRAGRVTPAAVDDDGRVVRVLASWPADWDEPACVAAQEWLAGRLSDTVARTREHARWSIRGQRLSGTELLSAGERVLDVLQREGRDDPVVLLACHSDLDGAAIGRLAAEQRLFTAARRPKVPMPGEGAAVLVLAAVPWPAAAIAPSGCMRLYGPAVVRRTQPVDTPGHPETDDAVRLVRHSLDSARLAGAAVAKLATDADRHTPRATELSAVTLQLLPHLIADEDLRLAGTISGRLEAAAPLVTLALAARQAAAEGKPAVALSLADPHWRMAAVLQPDTCSAVST